MSTNDIPKSDKPASKTEARKPRGLMDRNAADIAATEVMMATIREVYSRYGFDALETPFLEYTDALGKFLPDQDRPNAGVFSLRDDDEQWMSLRYDLTAPLARYCAENWQNLPKPYRSYRAGWVFRNEKPGPGRFRQFMQFDADTVGAASVAADAEICMMAADTLEALGIKRGYYAIRVSNRKVLDGLMAAIGLGGDGQATRRLIVLRALDKLDKFGVDGVQQLLGEGRWEGEEVGKGDFTKGAKLNSDQIASVLRFCSPDNFQTSEFGSSPARNKDPIATLKYFKSLFQDPIYQEGIEELEQIASLIVVAGYGPKEFSDGRIQIDPSVVRGLEYYTGPVYEAELLFDVTDEDGKPVRFGSVGGGGRYDGLVSRFLNEPVPATGFSIGVSRLLAALQALGKVSIAPVTGPVLVLAMDREPEAMAAYQKIVADLRNAGIRSEIYLGSSGMKAQMKYADRRGSPVAVIQGSSEREKEWVDPVTGKKEIGTAQIKDLILGAELQSGGKDRADYLAKQAEAQFEVPVSGIVEAVKKVLARRG